MADTMVALDKAKYKTVCLASQWYEILIIILLPLSADSLKWSESHGLKKYNRDLLLEIIEDISFISI